MLLILVSRPYDIGDRIHISDVSNDTKWTGSPGWIVKDVNLFSTVAMFGATNEVAIISNSAISGKRIINCARSPNATLNFVFKFPIDAPYDRIQIFKVALEKFIKDRPREWACLYYFYCKKVEADLGFIEYVVSAIHRGKLIMRRRVLF
jgi:small-conductance mechanosensitive channel